MVQVYHRTQPEALEREATTKSQKDITEGTLIWGTDNALPLRIAQAIEDSPAASSCIDTVTKFIKGAKFSDPDLMKLKVDKSGKTLWDLHTELSASLAWIRAFSVNFKFNVKGKITQAYSMSVENCRFVKPDDDLAKDITDLKYNPYFGTSEYNRKYTKEYKLWDAENLLTQIKSEGTKFKGQVYFYGETAPLSRFYPKPRFWSAKKWIYIDGKIQEGHAENMDNGFFLSVLIQMIGDPSVKSKNPAYMKREIVDGVEKLVPDKTVGQEFSDMMSANFSGTKKQGSALVMWATNKDNVANIEAFPSATNADLFIVIQDLTTKNITIAMKVPGILANISEGVSLGSDGNEMQKAVELMQSNTIDDRTRLEQFYNEVLFPNAEIEGLKKGAKVEIVNYNPITTPVEIEDKFWNVLNDREKRDFVRKNFSGIELEEEAVQTDSEGNALPPGEIQINDNLRGMTGRQQQQLMRIMRLFGKGDLNEETAKIQLKGFGFTDEEIIRMLGLDEVAQETPEPVTA
jgi:hypothetical protein